MSRLLVVASLFLVNFCSLVFEVVASRKAATYLGATAYANSTILAAFLAGIGLGGWAAGAHRLTLPERRRWAMTLLVIAGGFSVSLPTMLVTLTDHGPAGTLARGFILATFVVPVGLAVGFSYPIFTALYAARDSLGRSVATTYAADTVGAAAGSLTAGFLLVPRLGLATTGLLAGIGFLATAGILATASVAPVLEQPSKKSPDAQSGVSSDRFILGLFFFTGLAALALEVAWIRLFTLIIGTSLFSFAVTIAAFLAALAIGSHLIRGRVDRIIDLSSTLSGILFLIAASCPVLLLLAPLYERIYLAAYQASGSVLIFEAMLFGLGLVGILVPAGLMGAGFSIGVRMVAPPGGDAAVATGRLYGFNTLGGVVGALAGGLVLLPSIGVRGAILVAAGIYLLGGVALSIRAGLTSARPRFRILAPLAVASLTMVWLAPEPRLFFAPYYHGLRLGSYEQFSSTRAKEELIYHRFSPYGLITVSRDAEYRYLRHNGRSEASTTPGDMSTQLLIAHLPMLMHPAPKVVMNIGLGAGFTLGAIEQHPEAELIVQAELDSRIVDAAQLHFADVTDDALADARIEVHVTDGRKLLAGDARLYDVIISEPSHLWVSGVSGLFTVEFYRIVDDRLQPGGIFATWVPRYEMGEEDIRIVAATLLRVFSHVTAFENGPSDIIFLASKAPFQPSLEHIGPALLAPGVHRDIMRALEGFPLTPENLTHLLTQVAANAEAMPLSVTEQTPLNTDDWPVLEFHTALAAVSKHGEHVAQEP